MFCHFRISTSVLVHFGPSEKTASQKSEESTSFFKAERRKKKDFLPSSTFLTHVLFLSCLSLLLGTSPTCQSSHLLFFWSHFYAAFWKVRQRKNNYSKCVLVRQMREGGIPSPQKGGKIRVKRSWKLFFGGGEWCLINYALLTHLYTSIWKGEQVNED